MLAIMFLPRQFQVTVIENKDERHLNKAIWLFPLYMLAINVFVLPIAFGGRLHFPGGIVDADTYVLTIPMAERQELLALLVFIGGLSAATGMVIVETIALSTMVCNDLVMPVLLRMRSLRLNERPDLTGLLLGIRRGAIVLILLLGYLYFRLALEGRHARRRARRPDRGFRGVVVHASPARARALRLAADRHPRARAGGD
jgi:Na+/proline symporter